MDVKRYTVYVTDEEMQNAAKHAHIAQGLIAEMLASLRFEMEHDIKTLREKLSKS